MQQKDINKLYLVFHDCLDFNHVHGREYASIENLIDFFRLEGTPFVRRIFGAFDHSGNGQIDFLEFAITLWAYCPLTGPDFPLFTFDLYDWDGRGRLEYDQLQQMFADLFGPRHAEDRRAAENLAKMSGQAEEKDLMGKGMVTAAEFQNYSRAAPSMLFPAFQVQNNMRRHAGGQRYWKRVARARAREEKKAHHNHPRLHMLRKREQALEALLAQQQEFEVPGIFPSATKSIGLVTNPTSSQDTGGIDRKSTARSPRDGGGGGGGAPPAARRLEAGVARYFAGAADQAGKMNLGQLQSITAFYENLMLYHINLLPLVVTLAADSQAAVGAVRAGAADVRAALAPVAAVVAEALDDRDLRGG